MPCVVRHGLSTRPAPKWKFSAGTNTAQWVSRAGKEPHDRTPEGRERSRCRVLQRIKAFVRDSKGVAALEYAILIGVIVVGIGIALNALTTSINTEIDNAKDAIEDVTKR